MGVWNPWRGCKRYSEGCKYCYIHKGDAKRNIDTSNVVKTKDFYKPREKFKNGNYKIKPGLTYMCFSTDFLIEEADEWRGECFKMIKERSDVDFLFLTKRIDRFLQCIPDDWGDGYDNVYVYCTIENQKNADYRLSILKDLPIKHKGITAQPLLERVNIEKYLDDIELVVVGGESDYAARPLDYDWVLDIREQCVRSSVCFEFRQCGTHFIKDGKNYTLQVRKLRSQARLANIDYNPCENDQLKTIAASYDRAIDLGRRGINQYDNLPINITELPEYKLFQKMQDEKGLSDSVDVEIQEYLNPLPDMKFVDLGCCLNLMFSGYDRWPSLYHGVDISSKTIELLKEYCVKHSIVTGSLYCGGMHETPYEDNYYDIGACIGSLEYFKRDYIKKAVKEMHRIVKSKGRFVLDIPDVGSPEFYITMKIEEYLGRPDTFDITISEFEYILDPWFTIIRKVKAGPMLQYFLENK